MGEKTKKSNETTLEARASTPEGREQQLCALAIDLAEKQLKEGTASSQVITHFLKLASSKAELEKEKLKLEGQLLNAKTEALESSKHIEALYKDAMDAMRGYQGVD